jgi:hypothetical protein
MTTSSSSYVEAYVVVDGAQDDEAMFDDHGQELLETWLMSQKEQAMAHPEQRTEIYLLDHGHPPDVEDCSCAQYLTDHHPFWAFGGSEVMDS